MFEPEGTAMANSKLEAILIEELTQARNLPAQAMSGPLKRNSAASSNNSFSSFNKDSEKLKGFIADAFKVFTKLFPEFSGVHFI